MRDTIVREAYPIIEEQYFNEGRAQFNAGNYAAARPLLERSYRFTSIHSTIGHNTLLYLANIALNDNNLNVARYHFEAIAQRYPETGAAQEAREWLEVN